MLPPTQGVQKEEHRKYLQSHGAAKKIAPTKNAKITNTLLPYKE